MRVSEPQIKSKGMVDNGIYGFELSDGHSWINFGRGVGHHFIIYMVGTKHDERNQGHATRLLRIFFQMVKKARGTIEIESYTAAGNLYLKHIIDRLSKEYGVRVI